MTLSKKPKGRDREIARIKKANKACAVGRLMLGEISNWQEFLKVETEDISKLPRRNLKSGYEDVRRRLKNEISQFMNRNFTSMSEEKLCKLYEMIKGFRGLEMPMKQFTESFSALKASRIKDVPDHATIVVSLWGLQFQFPEDHLTKDILESLRLARSAYQEIEKYRGYEQSQLEKSKDEVSSHFRKLNFAARSCLLFCFNLLEAYLNGLAWDYCQNDEAVKSLSNKKFKLLQDTGRTSLREKLLKYPEIISNRALWEEATRSSHLLQAADLLNSKPEEPKIILDILKSYRDALVHPQIISIKNIFNPKNLAVKGNCGIIPLSKKNTNEVNQWYRTSSPITRSKRPKETSHPIPAS